MVTYIVYIMSTRCEPAVHPVRFIASELDRVASAAFQKDLAAYLNFHIDPHNRLSVSEVADVLRWESASSILDYYDALLAVLQFAISAGHEELAAPVVTVTRSLQAKVNDPRLDSLLFELTGKEAPRSPAQAAAVGALNSFLVGDFVRADESAAEALNRCPESPDLREISARAAALRSSQTPRAEAPLNRRLLSRMTAVIAKQDAVSDDVDDLVKQALIFSGFPWSKALLGFLAREVSPDPLSTGGGIVHYAASGTPELSPLLFSTFPECSTRAIFAASAQRAFGRCPAVVYGLAFAGETLSDDSFNGWTQEEQDLLSCRRAWERNDLTVALEAAAKLSLSEKFYYQQKAIGIKALCLLRLGHTEECISFITTTYLRCPQLQIVLPLQEVFDALDASTRRGMKQNISLPIFYDTYCRFVDDSQSTERSYAYEDFLVANGLERPSQIISILDQLDHDKAVYYLRYLCLESIMDNSIFFQGTQDLRDERLALCRILVDIDAANAEVYQSEIKDILRRSMLKKRMREVEQSKIYVDVESIRNSVGKTMRESYLRYISLLKLRGETSAVQPYLHVVRNAESGNIEAKIKLMMPQNETADLLRGMFSELRDQFVSSTEHGLNGYLSARIRHGTLQGQLRNPLEMARLITQRDSATGSYKQNTYWAKRLPVEEEGISSKINASLITFSERFDELVLEIKDEWIQISKGPDESGLFKFAIDDSLTGLVARYVNEETSFEEFLDYAFSLLNEILQQNLNHIRARFDGVAKSRVSDLLTALQSDIEQWNGYLDTSDISSAITRARTGLQLAIDRIIEWFRLSDAVDDEPFRLEEVIGVAVESVRTPANGFEAVIHDPTDHPFFFRSRLLAVFVDILFIVFENIVRHSATAGSPKAFVFVKSGEKKMTLLIENEIGKAAAAVAPRARVKEIEEAMRQNQHKKAMTTEGGTGFLKISKFLRHDFGLTPELNIGFRNDQRFFVEFSLPFSLIAVEV